MAWTTPMTFVASSALTAGHLNAFIRDNLNETAVAKATTAGRHFVATGVNGIAERASASATIATAQALSNTTVFGDLATVGPTVTVTTGTQALVFYANQMQGTGIAMVAYAVSGATTTIPNSITENLWRDTGNTANTLITRQGAWHYAALNAGSNTFTTKYATGSTSSTVTFSNRFLLVIAL